MANTVDLVLTTTSKSSPLNRVSLVFYAVSSHLFPLKKVKTLMHIHFRDKNRYIGVFGAISNIACKLGQLRRWPLADSDLERTFRERIHCR